MLEEFRAGQTMQILHAHSSFLPSLPRCYYMHEFSVNHMRKTNAHNSLSAQSDQPYCFFAAEIALPFYIFFVSSGSQAGVKGFV